MRTRTRRVAAVLAAGAAAVVLATALLATALHMAGGRQPATARGRDAGHPAASGQSGPAAPGGRTLHLVNGSGWVNGIYTEYPHSQAGAVSAAVEFITGLGSTLNPDRAAAVARLVADPSYHAAAQDAAAGTIAARRGLGLPMSGPPPPDAGAFLVPVMYQLHLAGADRATVLLLFDYTVTAASGIAEHIGVTALRLTWTTRSWRLLHPAGNNLAGLLATPGTAAAAAKGWEAMTYAM